MVWTIDHTVEAGGQQSKHYYFCHAPLTSCVSWRSGLALFVVWFVRSTRSRHALAALVGIGFPYEPLTFISRTFLVGVRFTREPPNIITDRVGNQPLYEVYSAVCESERHIALNVRHMHGAPVL